VYVWNFGNGQGPFAALSAAKFDLHQNGVNGLDVSIQGPLVFLATGGDDGMVAVSLVDLSDDDLKLIWTRREFASGSTVRAVRFLDSGRVVSVGTDQVVKVWDFTGDGNTDLRLVAEQRTSIADIGDLELMSMEGKAMAVIVGQGLEMSIVINDLTQ
jgi:WD40 repeat protein